LAHLSASLTASVLASLASLNYAFNSERAAFNLLTFSVNTAAILFASSNYKFDSSNALRLGSTS